MAFSIGAGDIIKALELVGSVIDALRASGRLSDERRALLRQLYDLETSLQRVKRLTTDDAPANEIAALNAAACHCQQTIDDFWKNFGPYDVLRQRNRRNAFQRNWSKIKWAVLHRDDLQKFKIDLLSHTEAIQMLLSTIQVGNSTRSNHLNKTLASRMQNSYSQTMNKLGKICKQVSITVRQGKQLLSLMHKVLQDTGQIFQVLIQLQHLLTRIPGQIERQQPVFLIDAFGKESPFHLEFIRSIHAFKDVLIRNFEAVGAGDKIRNNEFAITDVASNRDVDLSTEWTAIFLPGQRVKMSIIFSVLHDAALHCPTCNTYNDIWDTEIECCYCGVFYSRFREMESESHSTRSFAESGIAESQARGSTGISSKHSSSKRKRPTADIGPEKFRNVRLKHESQSQLETCTNDRVSNRILRPFSFNAAASLCQLDSVIRRDRNLIPSGENFTCPWCYHQRYKSDDNWERDIDQDQCFCSHVRDYDQGKCPDCGRRFTNLDHLRTHVEASLRMKWDRKSDKRKLAAPWRINWARMPPSTELYFSRRAVSLRRQPNMIMGSMEDII